MHCKHFGRLAVQPAMIQQYIYDWIWGPRKLSDVIVGIAQEWEDMWSRLGRQVHVGAESNDG